MLLEDASRKTSHRAAFYAISQLSIVSPAFNRQSPSGAYTKLRQQHRVLAPYHQIADYTLLGWFILFPLGF